MQILRILSTSEDALCPPGDGFWKASGDDMIFCFEERKEQT